MNAKYTVKTNADFRRIYSKGKSHVGPFLVVYSRKNRLDHNRCGYTVSVKLGHAVVRNRIKRRLREAYRLNSASVAQGYDIIIVARGRCVSAPFKKLEGALRHSLSELGLLV